MRLFQRSYFWLLAYAATALLLGSEYLRPLPATLLAAPFALVVPTGVGLLLCFGWSGVVPEGIGRVQVALLSFFFGTVVIIYTYVLLERYGYTHSLADPLLLAFLCAAAAGYMRMRHLFTLASRDRQVLRLLLLICVPLVGIRYFADLMIYSNYPVIDLFQRLHFHSGAMDFAKHDVLNPFTADSYIPYQQLLLGILTRNAHVEPLMAEWILPLVMAPLQIAAVYAIVTRLASNWVQRGIALGISFALLGFTNPTNGDVAAMAALLVLSLLLIDIRGEVSARRNLVDIVLVLGATVGGVFLYREPILASFSVLLCLALCCSWCTTRRSVKKYGMLVIAVLACVSFHRASILFLFMIGVFYALLMLYRLIRHKHYAEAVLLWLSVGVVIVAMLMSLQILVNRSSVPLDEFGLWPWFDYLLKPLTGKSMVNVAVDPDLGMGAGGRIALFEIGRKLSLFCFLIGGVLLIRIAVQAVRTWRVDVEAKSQLGGLGRADDWGVLLLLSCLLLLALTLTGFPFVHRGSFLVIVLLSIATARNVEPLFERFSYLSSKTRVMTVTAPVSYMAVLFIVASVLEKGASQYSVRVYPLLMAVFSGAVALAVCVSVSWGRRPALFLGMLLVGTVVFEVTLSKAYFKHYAFYSQNPPQGGALSHYGVEQLQTADHIAEMLDRDAILISDPKSVALIAARSGNLPIMSFSNLHTIENETRRELVALLRSVIDGASLLEVCDRTMLMSNSLASAQLNYSRLFKSLEKGSGREALMTLGYNNALLPRYIAPSTVNRKFDDILTGLKKNDADPFVPKNDNRAPVGLTGFVFVISPDTFDWMTNPESPSYFPVNGKSSELKDVLARYDRKGWQINNTFILSVQCE